jgi:hypothetical protein
MDVGGIPNAEPSPAVPVTVPAADRAVSVQDLHYIPPGLAGAFQEYDFTTLDAERDSRLVIERTLARGTRSDMRWLVGRYGRPPVQAWLRELGHRRLPRRRYALWCLVFEVPELPRPSAVWPH